MSATKSTSKRKRQEESSNDSSSKDEDEQRGPTMSRTVFSSWLDEGSPPAQDGSTDHQGVSILINGVRVDVCLGDAVLLRSPPADELGLLGSSSSVYKHDPINYYADSPTPACDFLLARVERIWEDYHHPASSYPAARSPRRHHEVVCKFKARWFLKKHDMNSVHGNFAGVASNKDFIRCLTEHDLILSNKADDNAVTTICGAAQVLYRQPSADKLLPAMLPNTFVCRYSLAFGGSHGSSLVRITPFTGDNDDWKDFLTTPRGFCSQRLCLNDSAEQQASERSISGDRHQSDELTSMSSSRDTEDERKIEPQRRSAVDEGTVEKREIRVGDEHQARVPPFVPNQNVVSRKPRLVWSAGKVSEEKLDIFLNRVSEVLTPYLRHNRLTHEAPYSPLSWDRMESMVRKTGQIGMPTLSSVCTAASLSSKSADLLRECDVDSILLLLHDQNYNSKDALSAIRSSPKDFLTVWSPMQKDLFNSSFRRYAGSLRMIYKAVTPSKDFQDVIDYHYRFKIPDQYRHFQEAKQEQAVHMMECMEARRRMSTPVSLGQERRVSDPAPSKNNDEDWLKTSIYDVTGALEDRRAKAKALLLDVEAKLGVEKLLEAVDFIKKIQSKSMDELRNSAVQIFKGNEKLKERFLEFLPIEYQC